MKKLVLLSVLFGLSMSAHATLYMLKSCEFKYMPEYGKSVYIGTYKSSFGNYFTKVSTTYCAVSITQ